MKFAVQRGNSCVCFALPATETARRRAGSTAVLPPGMLRKAGPKFFLTAKAVLIWLKNQQPEYGYFFIVVLPGKRDDY
jgi:hypothetical protein